MSTLRADHVLFRVAVIDAQPLFRAGVIQTLLKATSCKVVAEGDDAEDAMSIAQQLAPDLMVLDLGPDLNGGRLREIVSACTRMRIIILTAASEKKQVTDALRAGAAGYLLKSASAADLVESIQRVYRGEAYISPFLAARLLGLAEPDPELDRFSCLSGRECSVLNHLATGLSNKEIGRKLNLSDKTVKHCTTALFEKLQTRNRVEAALLWQRRASSAISCNAGA